MNAPSDDTDSPFHRQDYQSVVETALDVALLVMENGGSTFRADQTFQAMLGGVKDAGVTALWHLDSVTVFMQRDGQMATMVHPIRVSGVTLTRVSAAWALERQVATGAIAHKPHPSRHVNPGSGTEYIIRRTNL